MVCRKAVGRIAFCRPRFCLGGIRPPMRPNGFGTGAVFTLRFRKPFNKDNDFILKLFLKASVLSSAAASPVLWAVLFAWNYCRFNFLKAFLFYLYRFGCVTQRNKFLENIVQYLSLRSLRIVHRIFFY